MFVYVTYCTKASFNKTSLWVCPSLQLTNVLPLMSCVHLTNVLLGEIVRSPKTDRQIVLN